MSTPTRYQQWSNPIMNGPLGYADPEEPDPDPADPVDYASLDEGGAVQVGLDLGSVAIVNDFRILTSSTHPDWSSDFTPEAGNVILVYVFQRNAGTAAAPTGWTRLAFSGPSSPVGSDTTISVYAKVSDGTETTMDYNIGVATARDYIILELSGVSLADYETNTDSGSTTSITSGSVTPTAGLDAIIIGAVAATPDEILGQSYTPGGSYTELYDATGTAAPFETLYYQIVSPTSGSYDPDTTINNLAVGHTWRGLTVALVSSSATAWYPAPAANDGDTATSAFGDATGACMRVALEVDRLIYRIDLDIGQETAGATVYEFYGTDDPSFASTTLLATLSFTATGSFTLDAVTESWVPTTTFQYYELVHVSGGGSDRELYEVRLYSSVDAGGEPTADAHISDPTDAHDASAISVSPAVNGETDVQGALEDHETRIDDLEAAGGDVDASDVGLIDTLINTSTVQEWIDIVGPELWGVDSVGSLTAGGSPVTVTDDASWNNFPGLCRLDVGRVLLVYRKGTTHLVDGKIVGKIGTLAADRGSVSSWGTEFDILDDAEDLRLEDGVSVIDNQIVIAYRYYDGSDNHDPSLIICDDPPATFASSSTWGSPIALPDPGGTVQEYTQGHVQKLSGGTYILGGGFDSGGDHTTGVWRWTGSVGDPSAASFVTVGSGANDYSEICIEELSDGTVRALLRSDTNTDIDTKTSTDAGATWSSVGNAFDGFGNPMLRQFASGLVLTVYRDAPDGDTAWRASSDGGTTWGSETILDTTGTRNEYATLLQLTPTKILCAYALDDSGGEIRTQVFTDSSTFAVSIAGVTPADTVSDETTWGITPDAGVSDEYSRGDHTHGSPTEPTGGGGVPPAILLESDHATPFTFDEILQESDGSDFLWASE